MPMTDEDRLDYALQLSRRTRDGLKRLPPSPKRREALSVLLGLLADFKPPAGAPVVGRRTSPEWAIWRERRAEMQRLRSMMDPRRGSPTVYVPVGAITTKSFWGWMNYVGDKLFRLQKERMDLERYFNPDASFTEAAERRETVQKIQGDLRTLRLETSKRYGRWRKGQPDALPADRHYITHQYTALLVRMDMARAALDRLAEGC